MGKRIRKIQKKEILIKHSNEIEKDPCQINKTHSIFKDNWHYSLIYELSFACSTFQDDNYPWES